MPYNAILFTLYRQETQDAPYRAQNEKPTLRIKLTDGEFLMND